MTQAEAFTNDIWNDFYEKAWGVRKSIMERMIKEGEKHPLRIISKFESISRFSEQERRVSQEGEVFNFIEDKRYQYPVSSNVLTDNNSRNIQILEPNTLPTGLNIDKKLPHRSGWVQCSEYTYNNNIDFLVDFCRKREFDCVVELGSGYSQNLIKLFYNGGPDVPYYAGEYTESGTQCAQMLSNLDPNLSITAFRFDYKNPDLSNIPKKKNVLVFTCHSIEQVTQLPNELIEEIASLGEIVTCIHIEPFAFQLKGPDQDTPIEAEHRSIFTKNRWNQNLVSCLVYHHLNRRIDIKYLAPNVMGGVEGNPSSLAIWVSS